MDLRKYIDKKNIGFLIFSFVNILFSAKYFSRITDYYWALAIVVLFMHALLFYKGAVLKRFIKNYTIVNISLLIVFCIFCFVVFKKIPVEMLNVDRWSVITSFWDTYFNGEYVYYAQSHMNNNNPGAMPIYFVLALPFYYSGELGYFAMMGIIVFYLTMRYLKVEKSIQTLFLLLLMTSPFYLYEIMVRSPLFLNASLIAFSILFFFHLKNYQSFKNQIIISILFGLSLSTRNVFALCYIILFIYCLKNKKIDIISTIKIGLLTVTVFALTFLPFIIGHFDDFTKMNPFILQSSSLMPFRWVLVATACSAILFLLCKKDSDVIFYSGVSLLITIGLYFAYQIITNSFEIAYQGSNADIAYFIMCTPFFLCYMLSYSSQEVTD
jgi:hypothetical protein